MASCHVWTAASTSEKERLFLHCIVTGDEKWLHYDNLKRRRSWGKTGHNPTPAAKPNIHRSNLLLLIWWEQMSVVHYEQLKPTNHGWSLSITVDTFEPSIEEKQPLYEQRHDKVILQDNNAWPDVAKLTLKRLNRKSYPNRRIHQTLPRQIITCSVDGIWLGWAALLFL